MRIGHKSNILLQFFQYINSNYVERARFYFVTKSTQILTLVTFLISTHN